MQSIRVLMTPASSSCNCIRVQCNRSVSVMSINIPWTAKVHVTPLTYSLVRDAGGHCARICSALQVRCQLVQHTEGIPAGGHSRHTRAHIHSESVVNSQLSSGLIHLRCLEYCSESILYFKVICKVSGCLNLRVYNDVCLFTTVPMQACNGQIDEMTGPCSSSCRQRHCMAACAAATVASKLRVKLS